MPLFIKHISLTQFRNYTFQSFSFDERIIGITGSNGAGKTNLLDAIYYLCFTKSYFSGTDSQNVHHGMQGMRIHGVTEKNGDKADIVFVLRENNRKEFSVNDVLYKKNSEHIGQYPCVMVAPDDTLLITGGSEERRKFIDILLSQLSHDYLNHLIDYNKILQQRNGLLKSGAESRQLDIVLLDVLDEQLCNKGNFIFAARKQFIDDLIPVVMQQYNYIAGTDDHVSIVYNSQLLQKSFSELLIQNRDRDIYLQRTSGGIHRDDLEILISTQLFKHVASQGQRKSLLFALKLSEYQFLQQHNGFPPLLLLDDVFEKLDMGRMNNLLHRVCVEGQGQVFITDTHADRILKAFYNLKVQFRLISLSLIFIVGYFLYFHFY